MVYKRKTKREDLEPLKQVPDYVRENKRGSLHKALQYERIFFVDENYRRLIVSSSEVKRGGEPTKFTGILPYFPIKGDIISTEDFSEMFEVVRRHMIPSLSPNLPPKVYIVLRSVKINSI